MAFYNSIRDAMASAGQPGTYDPVTGRGYRQRLGRGYDRMRYEKNALAFDDYTTEQQQIGSEATGDYYGRLKDFDATETANRYARGMADEVYGDLRQSLDDEAERAVGAGRLNTGFYDIDRGNLYQDANRRLGTALAQGAFTATGMQQRNTEAIGALGSERSLYGAEAARSLEEQYLNREAAASAERRQRKRFGLGTIVGGVGGFLAGGPAGAIYGAAKGSGY